MTIQIPIELEALRDAAVAYAHGRLENCPELTPLEDWFENGDGWDDVVMNRPGFEGGSII